MSRRWLPPLAIMLALAWPAGLLAGSVEINNGTGSTYTLHLTTLKEAKFRNTIRQKYDFSCGSAAVATLLTYQYGYPVTEQMAFAQMYAHGDRAKINKEGFSLLDIKDYLQTLGFEADGFRLPLDKLVQEHLPAIVLIEENRYHHFVVVKGLLGGRVLVGDPALGTRSIPRDRFEKLWKDKLLFVIHNRRDLAHFNLVSDWRAAPLAPLGMGIDRRLMDYTTMPKFGPGQY
ncbi:C39 family peptidase [Rhodanobacter geophilus]|uniref:C39 family peptidase n=1 Tax=Rhodanobacter geophilus TaxID=3162488 RepID=A0ABV3QKD8_9GAMM